VRGGHRARKFYGKLEGEWTGLVRKEFNRARVGDEHFERRKGTGGGKDSNDKRPEGKKKSGSRLVRRQRWL